MASETGYVSSFDEQEGFGFIRPAQDPKSLVKFRHDAVGADAITDIRPGVEVRYQLAGPESGERWPIAGSVTVERPVGTAGAAVAEPDGH
jgi:cold shock CspA family protein